MLEARLGKWTAETNQIAGDADGLKGRKFFFDKNWEDLSDEHNVLPNTPESKEQWQTCLRVLRLLQQYNKALVDASQVQEMGSSTARHMGFFKFWKRDLEGGRVCLLGR
jgi:hypothetical protein